MGAVRTNGKTPSGFGLNLYSRRGMQEILDVVGYEGGFRVLFWRIRIVLCGINGGSWWRSGRMCAHRL